MGGTNQCTELMNDDFRQIEKTQAVIEAHPVYSLLVSEQQELCGSRPATDQPATNAALDGSQGRMASLRSLFSHILHQKQPIIKSNQEQTIEVYALGISPEGISI